MTYDFSVLLVAVRAPKSAAFWSPEMHYVAGLYDTIITLYQFVWSMKVNKQHYRQGYWVFGLVHCPVILSVGHHRHDTLVAPYWRPHLPCIHSVIANGGRGYRIMIK